MPVFNPSRLSPFLLDKSTTAVTATTAAATTLFSFSVPGNTLGTNGILRLNMNGIWNVGGTSRTCTISVSYGALTLWSDTTQSVTNGNTLGWVMNLFLAANNSTSAQTLTGQINFSATGTASTGVGHFSTNGALGNLPVALTSLQGTSAFASTGPGAFVVTVAFSGTTTAFTKNIHTLEVL